MASPPGFSCQTGWNRTPIRPIYPKKAFSRAPAAKLLFRMASCPCSELKNRPLQSPQILIGLHQGKNRLSPTDFILHPATGTRYRSCSIAIFC